MRLCDAKINTKYKIIEVNAPLKMKRRIFDLGCVPNTIISVYAKTKQSSAYIVRGVVVSIDKNIAKCIVVADV